MAGELKCPLCRGRTVGGRHPASVPLLRCIKCSNTFSPDRVIEPAGQERSRALVRRIDHVPQGVTVRREASAVTSIDPYRGEARRRDDLELHCRLAGTRRRKELRRGAIVAALLWNLMNWGLLWTVFTTGAPMLFKLTVIPGALSGLALIYVVVSWFVNSKVIQVRGDELRAFETPLSLGSPTVVKADQIDQVWVRSGVEPFELMVRTTAGRQVRLLKGIADPVQALSLEQEIEDCLGLVDVADEHELVPAQWAPPVTQSETGS